MGRGTSAESYGETAVGVYSESAGSFDPTNFVASDRLFLIGNGTSDQARSNALVMLKNGNTTLNGELAVNGVMSHSSTGNTPNLKLDQGSSSNFARLRLAKDAEPDFWDVAAGGEDNVFNIYLDNAGNALRLHSDYSSGGPNLMSMINGARLTSGGAWTNASDRALKDGFQAVDTDTVLAKVLDLPLSEWSYKREPGVRHIGPVAQDFHAAFALGSGDTSIATVDADGVALAAIQGLHRKLEASAAEHAATVSELKAENLALQEQLAGMQAQVDSLREENARLSAIQARLAAVESALSMLPQKQQGAARLALADQALPGEH